MAQSVAPFHGQYRKGDLLTYIHTYRYSGYTWTDKLKDTSTATVTAKLNGWFVEYGYPEYIRTDGGPQFLRMAMVMFQ